MTRIYFVIIYFISFYFFICTFRSKDSSGGEIVKEIDNVERSKGEKTKVENSNTEKKKVER